MITLFRDLKQTDKPFYLPVEKVLDRIKNGSSKELCDKIRQYEGPDNKAKRNELKDICVFKKLSVPCTLPVDPVFSIKTSVVQFSKLSAIASMHSISPCL